MNKTCYCRTISNAAVMDSFESCYFIFLCSLGFLGVPSFPSSMRLNGNYSVLLSKHTGWAIKIRTHYFDLTLSHDEILAILKVYSFYSTLSFFWGINLFPRLTEKSSKHDKVCGKLFYTTNDFNFSAYFGLAGVKVNSCWCFTSKSSNCNSKNHSLWD